MAASLTRPGAAVARISTSYRTWQDRFTLPDGIAHVLDGIHATPFEEHGWRTGRISDPFGYDWEISRQLTRPEP
jgi:hypothetical protein